MYSRPSIVRRDSRRFRLASVLAVGLSSVLLTGCLHDDDDDDDVAASTTSTVEEITSKTVEASDVTASVLVPSASTVKTLVADRGFDINARDLLLVLHSLVPQAMAIDTGEGGDLQSVDLNEAEFDIQDVDLFRYTPGTGFDGDPIAIPESVKTQAFVINADGTLNIDLEALADSTEVADFEALLDTSVVVELDVTVSVDDDNDENTPPVDVNITMRAPLVDTSIDVSPLTEFAVRVINQDKNRDLSELNISEVRKLVENVAGVNIEGIDEIDNPDDLVTALLEAAGGQLAEQFEAYLAPEPTPEQIAANNRRLNVIALDQYITGSPDPAPHGSFGFGEQLGGNSFTTVDISLDSGGNGSATFNVEESEFGFPATRVTPQFIDELETETDTGSFTGGVELLGDGSLLFSIPGLTEFPDADEANQHADIYFEDPSTFRLTPDGQAGSYTGFWVIRANKFGIDDGITDFSDLHDASFISSLLLALPEAPNLSVNDFTSDLGMVYLDTRVIFDGNAHSARIEHEAANEHFEFRDGEPGKFDGGLSADFEIGRDTTTGTFTGGPDEEANTDILSINVGENGRFTISSNGLENIAAAQGIAAPGATLLGLVGSEVVCEDEQGVQTEQVGDMNCPEGTSPVDADIGFALAVPVAVTPTLQAGDIYRVQSFEFDSQSGYESCRGTLAVSGGPSSFSLDFSDERCQILERADNTETSLLSLTSETRGASSLPVIFNGAELTGQDNDAIRGYVSEDQNTIILRFADANDPFFAGIMIARRISEASSQ